jgi:hypothetical protein
MGRTPRHQEVELRFRALLDDAELPHPDRIECEPGSVVFYWDEPRLAVIVDLNPDVHDPLDRLDLAPIDNLPPDQAPRTADMSRGVSGGTHDHG